MAIKKMRVVKRSGSTAASLLQDRETADQGIVSMALALSTDLAERSWEVNPAFSLSYQVLFLDEHDRVVEEERLLGERILVTDRGRFVLGDRTFASLLDAVVEH